MQNIIDKNGYLIDIKMLKMYNKSIKTYYINFKFLNESDLYIIIIFVVL